MCVCVHVYAELSPHCVVQLASTGLSTSASLVTGIIGMSYYYLTQYVIIFLIIAAFNIFKFNLNITDFISVIYFVDFVEIGWIWLYYWYLICIMSQVFLYTTYKLQVEMKRCNCVLLVWQKSKSLTEPVLALMWSNRSSHSLLVGIQSGTATLPNNLWVPGRILLELWTLYAKCFLVFTFYLPMCLF